MTGIGVITKKNEDGSVEVKELSSPEILKELTHLKRELTAACEERDRYKADSEVLEFLMRNYPRFFNEVRLDISYNTGNNVGPNYPEHLRKRLEGK